MAKLIKVTNTDTLVDLQLTASEVVAAFKFLGEADKDTCDDCGADFLTICNLYDSLNKIVRDINL